MRDSKFGVACTEIARVFRGCFYQLLRVYYSLKSTPKTCLGNLKVLPNAVIWTPKLSTVGR